MGNAMMGSGEAEGENRALRAAERALTNPLLGDISIKVESIAKRHCVHGLNFLLISITCVQDAKGMILNITGGSDLTLFEVDEAADRVTQELDDPHANIIFGSTFDESLHGKVRVSVVATGIADPDK